MADQVDTASQFVALLEQPRPPVVIEYTIIYLERRKPKTAKLRCSGAEDRNRQMKSELSVDVSRHNWAAGYLNSRGELELCGNNATARLELRKLFPNRRLAR